MPQNRREMEDRIASYDWEKSAIGPRSDWSPTLQLIVNLVLQTRFPMLIWWGKEHIQIYNDAYIPLMGGRHPLALGQTAEQCWPEVWNVVGPLLHQTFTTGEPVWGENTPFTIENVGIPETRYFTFSYSRIGDEREAGILCTNVETTTSVVRELEFRTIADSIADIIYTHAPDGTIEWANSRWFEYTKLPEDIATSQAGWAEVVPSSDLFVVVAILETAFSEGTAYEAEIRIKPFGSGEEAYRWHLLRAVPIRGNDGNIVRWAGSATDVHDRRVAEEALREQLQRDLDREHQASLAFQNAALPQSLPIVDGFTFDAIYEAAGSDALVGGDWYDAFRLLDGRIVVSVGDVIGNGLAAAVTMAAARQAIRGAVQVHPEPGAALDAADRTLRSEQPDRIVTAFIGIFDPLTRAMSYASAGHPPPFLRYPDGTVVELEASDLPLGLRNKHVVSDARMLTLPEGGLLVLYTDGLTESTHDLFEGERRLREVLMREDIASSEMPAKTIYHEALDTVLDDVAILTLRIGISAKDVNSWSFQANDSAGAACVRNEILQILSAQGASDDEIYDTKLIFGELIGNVVRHTSGEVEVALDVVAGGPILHMLDRGPGFTFFARLPKDTMSESGRGLYIVAKLSQDVSVTPRPEGGSHARVVLSANVRT